MNIEAAFERTYGHAPEITAFAPGRVNLIGEHTDYNGGAVLPAALACRVDLALAAQDAPNIAITSTRFEATVERPVGDPKRGDWTDYAMGALTLAQQEGWLTGGAELLIDSNVPDGAGVSSSAALITAILRAAVQLSGAHVSPVEIAKQARAVENDYIGMPCGIMDQMAVGLANVGHALALDTSTLSYEVIEIPSDWEFVVIHSGIRRELADGRYKRRFEECQQASDLLQTDQLCRLDETERAKISTLPDPLRKRAAHVVSEHHRTRAATHAMKAGNRPRFAELMRESHRSYSKDFEASTPEIDALVAAAIETGADGARLTGGGFGGCLVALVEASKADAWASAFLAAHPGTWRV